MRCRKVRSFLSAYSKEEVSVGTAAKIKKHMDDCASCRRELGAIRSVQAMVKGMPGLKASDDFTARLLTRVAQERFAETKSKAYLPGRIPLFGGVRLAMITTTAVVVLALSISFNVGERFMSPSVPQAALTSDTAGSAADEDRYLSAQPTDNPLLNEHKSISRMVAQYNRWREYSKTLRSHSAAEQFAGTGTTVMAASQTVGGTNEFRVRPIVKNYLVVPAGQNRSTRRNTY
ncbi:MAG: hypothetical protein PHR28_06715 [candidate division Zixibacteria bacterium]|nr:hypothetical protein [candidate division Zixibacteria bacterium]